MLLVFRQSCLQRGYILLVPMLAMKEEIWPALDYEAPVGCRL